MSAASWLDRLKSGLLYALPHHLISRIVYRLTRVRWPFTATLIRVFSRLYRVNLAEAEQSDVAAYQTFNAFFTRALKSGARPLNNAADQVVCPADGRVSQCGDISAGQIFQAKGMNYSAEALLGHTEDALPFAQGSFVTVYLSPRDYHRVHSPMGGELIGMSYIPGRLFSVAPHTVNTITGLFTRNERVVCHYLTPYGHMAVVLVGAINVAAIETVHHGLITPPPGRAMRREQYKVDEQQSAHGVVAGVAADATAIATTPAPATPTSTTLATGAELGRFNMGSTAIVLLEQPLQWASGISAGEAVTMGQPLGKLASRSG